MCILNLDFICTIQKEILYLFHKKISMDISIQFLIVSNSCLHVRVSEECVLKRTYNPLFGNKRISKCQLESKTEFHHRNYLYLY